LKNLKDLKYAQENRIYVTHLPYNTLLHTLYFVRSRHSFDM